MDIKYQLPQGWKVLPPSKAGKGQPERSSGKTLLKGRSGCGRWHTQEGPWDKEALTSV